MIFSLSHFNPISIWFEYQSIFSLTMSVLVIIQMQFAIINRNNLLNQLMIPRGVKKFHVKNDSQHTVEQLFFFTPKNIIFFNIFVPNLFNEKGKFPQHCKCVVWMTHRTTPCISYCIYKIHNWNHTNSFLLCVWRCYCWGSFFSVPL